jgi:hypothetical protein
VQAGEKEAITMHAVVVGVSISDVDQARKELDEVRLDARSTVVG